MKRMGFFIVMLLLFSAASGQVSEKKQFRAVRVESAPVINGILDDDVWKEGHWSDDFTQHEPLNGRQASQRTEFSILFDDANIYVAVKNFDSSPDSIVNRMTRRDLPDGDFAGVIFDSFHDLRTGFMFGVSSSGVKLDKMYSGDGDIEDKTMGSKLVG
jgi:hypothetical protein